MKTYVAISDGPIRRSFFPQENVRLLESLGDVRWATTSQDAPSVEDVIRDIGDAEVYITIWGSPRLDAEILAAAPHVKLLVHLGGTIVPYASDAMWERGIRAISGNDHMAESVAEGCIAYMLTALRDIPKYSRALKEEKIWKTPESYSEGLLDRRIGIVSLGTISRYLIRMLQPFHPEILVNSRGAIPEEFLALGVRPASLDEIFETADIISIHTALNKHTQHMIGKDLLAKIKPGALFLNTARGGVIDETALIEELRDGRFRAFLDVYECAEPPTPDCELYTLPNVFMMPHMGGPTVDRYRYSTRDLILEADAYIKANDPTAPLRYEITREMTDSMSRS